MISHSFVVVVLPLQSFFVSLLPPSFSALERFPCGQLRNSRGTRQTPRRTDQVALWQDPHRMISPVSCTERGDAIKSVKTQVLPKRDTTDTNKIYIQSCTGSFQVCDWIFKAFSDSSILIYRPNKGQNENTAAVYDSHCTMLAHNCNDVGKNTYPFLGFFEFLLQFVVSNFSNMQEIRHDSNKLVFRIRLTRILARFLKFQFLLQVSQTDSEHTKVFLQLRQTVDEADKE